MTVDELMERVRGTSLARCEGWVRSVVRPAFDIQRNGEQLRVGGSRFGGHPDLPQSADWPMHAGGPYRFVGQFDLASLPETPRLPHGGLLSLFVADDPTGELAHDVQFWGSEGYAIALLIPPGTPVLPRVPPREVDLGEPAGITLLRTIDLPYGEEQVAEWPLDVSEVEQLLALRDQLHCRDHLLGYPTYSSLSYDPTPEGYEPLLTVYSSDEQAWLWHDGDYLMVFARPDALVRGDVSELRSDAG